jgi:G3E family GTPase
MAIMAPPTKPHAPLPVTVVSGYLGAGKTTLVNAILAGDHGLRIAVLVNDFGEVPVDEALIVNREGDVVALANGCMCCQIGGDLYDAIDRILRMRDRFDHLLIETSGVADPSRVAQIAIAEPDLELARTVVLVDAINFADVLGDPRLNDTLLRQVRAADVILLSKTDKVAATDLAALQAILIEAGISAPIKLLGANARDVWHIVEGSEGVSASRRAHSMAFHSLPFDSWSWRGNGKVDRAALLAFARDESLNIYRLKGRLHLTDGTAILLQKVGSEVTAENIADDFETCELVAIGAKPQFERGRVEAAWARLTQKDGVIAAQN